MALFKISKGNSTNLPTLANSDDGYSWFTYDDGKFYIDYKESVNGELKRKALNAEMADKDASGNIITNTYVKKSGDTITGNLDVVGNTNLHNETQIDSLTASTMLVNGGASFTQIPTAPTAADGDSSTKLATTEFIKWSNVANKPSTFTPPLAANGTRGGIQIGYSESGNNYAVKLSSEKAYVTVPWTDTKVTSVDNHYTPSANNNSQLTASATGATAAWSIDVVKGVQIQRDAKGHVTGVTVTSGKIPANPNTDYRVRQTNDTSNTNYRVLLSYAADNDQVDNITHKSGNLIYNPSANKLSTGNMQLTGTLIVSGQTTLNDNLSAQGITATDLLINGAANFIQSPTAPTPNSGDSSTKLATTAFVANAVSAGFAANDAMVFKGVLNSSSNIPASGYSAGWTYRIGTAGSYAGESCEVGDLLIAIYDYDTSPNTSNHLLDWIKVEHNIDGALYKGSATYTGSKILMSNGTSGAVKEATISTENVIKSITFSSGAVPTLGTAIAADDITAWSAGSVPTLGTAFTVPNVTGNTSVTASKVTKTDNTVVKTISQANSTSSIIGSVTNGVLTLIQAITTVGAVTAGSTVTASAVTITDVTATKTTLGTAFTIPNITSVGTAPSLSYTARSIPNVTSVGSVPTLSTTTQSVITNIS